MEKILAVFLGGGDEADAKAHDVMEKTAQKIASDVASEAIEKTAAETLVAKISEAFTGVGTLLFALQIDCALNKIITDGTIQKFVTGKARLEYELVFSQWQSSESQVKAGKADSSTLGASMEMLTSADGRKDIADSNNYQRSAGGSGVAYTPTQDCDKELCEQKQPGSDDQSAGDAGIIQHNAVLSALQAAKDDTSNPLYKVVGSFGFLYGSYSHNAFCAAYDKLSSIAGKALTFVFDAAKFLAEFFPGVTGAEDSLKQLMGVVISKMTNLIVPPIVTAATRGPALVNAIAEGADLAANSQVQALGAPKLTNAQAAEFDQKYFASLHVEHDRSSAWDKIAASGDPYSFRNQMLDRLPVSPRETVYKTEYAVASFANPTNILSTFKGLFANLGHGFSKPAVAAAYANPFGNSDYGFTDDCLAKPIGDPCTQVLDRSVACSMIVQASGDGSDLPSECNDVFNEQGKPW